MTKVRCTSCGETGSAGLNASQVERMKMGVAFYCPHCNRATVQEVVDEVERFFLVHGKQIAFNSPLLWAKGGAGYTQWLDQAERFTEDEADAHIRSTKGSHDFWKLPVKDAYDKARLTVDLQDLNRPEKAVEHVESKPYSLSPEQKKELADMDYDALLKDFEQMRRDASEDGAEPPSLHEFADGVAHGIVTCKYDTTIPCEAGAEEAAADRIYRHLVDRQRERNEELNDAINHYWR